jgi:L-ascorbate metabolism protein UlaG (beta-lactamase superfamily)
MTMTKRSIVCAVMLVCAAIAGPARAGDSKTKAKTEITWYGHAAFGIKTPSGKVLLIDPWIDNPANPKGKDDLAKLTAVDLILVTHGHADHVGNAVELGKRTKAKLVSTFDLGKALVDAGYPAEQAGMETQGNFGGTVTLFDGEVAITFVPAVHSSQMQKAVKGGTALVDAGAPGGFVIRIQGGPTIYHTGDTDLFGDMALIGQDTPIDLMLACIGGHFTMDPAHAAKAAKLVKPKQIVPMHFGTFPLLKGTPDELAKALRKQGVRTKPHVLEVGETMAW